MGALPAWISTEPNPACFFCHVHFIREEEEKKLYISLHSSSDIVWRNSHHRQQTPISILKTTHLHTHTHTRTYIHHETLESQVRKKKNYTLKMRLLFWCIWRGKTEKAHSPFVFYVTGFFIKQPHPTEKKRVPSQSITILYRSMW